MIEKLTELLSDFFHIGGDCYTYNLERHKSAFEIGTITTDDFREWNSDDVAELAAHLIANGVTIQRWHPVEEGLPPNGHDFEEYLVIMCTSHFPTSSFDPCDAPYSEEKVTTAKFDIQQSLWHFENGYVLNALIMPEDAPLNGDCVTHWAPMPHIP